MKEFSVFRWPSALAWIARLGLWSRREDLRLGGRFGRGGDPPVDFPMAVGAQRHHVAGFVSAACASGHQAVNIGGDAVVAAKLAGPSLEQQLRDRAAALQLGVRILVVDLAQAARAVLARASLDSARLLRLRLEAGDVTVPAPLDLATRGTPYRTATVLTCRTGSLAKSLQAGATANPSARDAAVHTGAHVRAGVEFDPAGPAARRASGHRATAVGALHTPVMAVERAVGTALRFHRTSPLQLVTPVAL